MCVCPHVQYVVCVSSCTVCSMCVCPHVQYVCVPSCTVCVYVHCVCVKLLYMKKSLILAACLGKREVWSQGDVPHQNKRR